jgi:PAS domain S-box-containing protein
LSDPRPAEILLVDDRPENLQALRAILGDQPGYSLVEATSGPEALREVLRHDFCLILLDAFLPGMDGVEVASLIKQRERTRDIPIIFLTAASMDQATLRRAYASGAADYLLKPISAEIVRAKVAVFVDLARKSAQLKEQAELLQEAERREQAIKMSQLRIASERRYRHLAEAIPQIVWRAMPDGQFEYWNHRWYDYTGANEGMAPEGAWAFLHPDDREKCQHLWHAAVRGGTPFQGECRLLRADGVYRWHLRRALPERGYVEAREAVRARDEFLTVAAHELRTPLTSLRLQVQRAAREEDAPDAARLTFRSVERLCRLADQLLDVSRMAGGQMALQFEQADLLGIVQETAARLREEAARNGSDIQVLSSGPVRADCDPLRIEQVVENLLTNAIKYGRGKPIEVSVSALDRSASVTVRDHGIGVRAEEQARIFEQFARAVSVRKYGGLGLGLFLSRQIVEAHGGSIRVSSVPGSGATFSVEFPLEHARAADEAEAVH